MWVGDLVLSDVCEASCARAPTCMCMCVCARACVRVACLTHIVIVSCSVQTADIWHLNYAVSLLVGSLHWQYDAVLDYGRASVMGLTA